MGIAPFEPTEPQRELVRLMASYGVPQERIAQAVGVSENTLRKHFRFELSAGQDVANAQVVKTLYRMATSGDCPAATIFWVKARLGWKEKAEIEVSGAGGAPITVKVIYENAGDSSAGTAPRSG